MDKTCALVLAAGDGKRMKSRHPKVLCEDTVQADAELGH